MTESFKAMSVRLELLAGSGVTCVVVEGPQGSGKTSLLRCLAANHGRIPQKDLLYLHLGEQIDGKVKGHIYQQRGMLRVYTTWTNLSNLNKLPKHFSLSFSVTNQVLPLQISSHPSNFPSFKLNSHQFSSSHKISSPSLHFQSIKFPPPIKFSSPTPIKFSPIYNHR